MLNVASVKQTFPWFNYMCIGILYCVTVEGDGRPRIEGVGSGSPARV